jgi:hypothetical protein
MPGFTRTTPVVAADFAVSSGWGTTPTVTVEAGSTDSVGRVSVLAQATTGANPTLVLTHKTAVGNPRDAGPAKYIVSRGDTSAPTTCFWIVSGTTVDSADSKGVNETAVTFQLVGTPTAGQTYVLSYHGIFG